MGQFSGSKCHVAGHLPAEIPLLPPCSSSGLPSPGPCCCPWTGRTPWPSSPFSQSCIRMKGSRPFWVSLLHGFGRDSMSLTLPWDRPSTWSGRQRHWHQRPGLSVKLQNALEMCTQRRRYDRYRGHIQSTSGAEQKTSTWWMVTAWSEGISFSR